MVDIVDGSAANLALEDVSDVTNTPVEELTPGITYELTGTLENDSTIPTNWTATDLTTTPGMTVTIADPDGASTPSSVGEAVDVSQFGITVQVDQTVTPSTELNFVIEFSSVDARTMSPTLGEPTAISEVFPDPAMAACVANDDESPAAGNVDYLISQDELNSFNDINCQSMGITNIEGIQYMNNLTSLNLAFNEITTITPLAQMYNLTFLDLGGNTISDISPLTNLVNLEDLRLGSNQISDINALSGLTNLTYLNLDTNFLTDISALANLTNLTGLRLSKNQITDISALTNLTNLTTLYLSDNQIEDISALSNMLNMTNLYLHDNEINDITALSNMQNLVYVNLAGNQITDFSSLTYQATTFYGGPQNVALSETALGTPTDIVIDGVNGEDLIITFNTPGTYVDGQLTWENPGVNSLTYASTDGKITGSITQTVN